MAEKRNGEERKERRKGGGEEAYREGTQGWKVMTVWSSGRGTIATSKRSAVQGSPGEEAFWRKGLSRKEGFYDAGRSS